MNKRPDVSIKLVLLAENHVLMLHRKSGSWEFPGGRLEWGETPEGALKRELKEELNYSIKGVPALLSLYNYIAQDGSQHSMILHYFLAIRSRPRLATTAEEPEAEVAWLDRNGLNRVIPNPQMIEQIFSRR